MKRNLTDKAVLITGASSGIGAATALACAQAGMNVAIGARREDRLQTVAQQIQSLGRKVLALPCDVTRDEDVQRLCDQAYETFGRLDVAYANAGYGLGAGVMEMTDQQHRDIFETNYWGTIRTIRSAVPLLRKTSDGLKHVLVCSSALSEIGLPYNGAYSATKAAQDSIAGALRGELHEEGFSVTSVHPVGTRTEFFSTVSEKSNHTFKEEIPHTPEFMVQSAETVANAIVRCLRRPKAELWPMVPVRLGLAISTAFPILAQPSMRKHARLFRQEQEAAKRQQPQQKENGE